MEHFFSKNLKYLREKEGLTQEELAKKLNLNRARLGHWENGTREPAIENIVEISNYFNISDIADLITEDLKMKNISTHAVNVLNGIKIPVLGRIPAGIPIEAIQDITDWEEIPKEWTTGGREYFALKIDGDSMAPYYNDGDSVIFLKQQDCDSGKDCAVMVNGYDATFKQVSKQDNGIMLVPLNSNNKDNYKATFYSNEDIITLPVKILGVAKEIRRKVK